MPDTLFDLLTERARRWPDAVALGSASGLGWESVTSSQLLERTTRLAGELHAAGVGRGDRVVLWAPNNWWLPAYLFALWKLGAIPVPFDREMNPEAASAIVSSVEARLVITGYGERPVWGGGHPLVEWWEPGSRNAAPIEDGASEPLAAIFFTSGTTGNPKGCMITHANLLSQVEALPDNVPLDPSTRAASILPLSHLFELTVGLLYPLASGAAIHYIPSRRAPDILRVFSEQRITHMVAVPQVLTLMGGALEGQLRAKLPGPAFNALMATADRTPFALRRRLFFFIHRRLGGHLEVIAAGGAALPPETQVLWERIGVRIIQGYGASETSPVIACGTWRGSPLGSVGKPIRNVEVKLAPDGELLVRGPNVMQGYWKDPVRTAEAIRDGWYHTGDVATIDPDGNVRLAGRAKDLIVLPSGLKVWPSDVEDVLTAHPAVKDAVVVMNPSAAGGATLHAFLLPESTPDASAIASILHAANSRLAVHQRLASASWYPEPDFPRTSTLKVRRQLLPRPDQVSAAAAPLMDDEIGRAIAVAARVASVRPEQTLAELGLDSLAIVNLALALEEKSGKPIADADLGADMTVAEVRAMIAGANDTGPDLAEQETISPDVPTWPYTWGRALRRLSAPYDLTYRLTVTKTLIAGREHLTNLPEPVIFAGTHHSFADVPVVRHALAKSGAKHLVSRLIIPAGALGFQRAGVFGRYNQLALGLYPIRQHSRQGDSLRGLINLARQGSVILIFPQGDHVDPQAEVRDEPAARFRTGVARLAEALGAAVVPFGLAGTEMVVPPHADGFDGLVIGGMPIRLKPTPLAIAFDAPLRIETGESIQAFTSRLQETCFALTRKAETALAEEREAALA
ncbi:MAG: AMP-binding protein [Dehalococcoidia bacterium]